MNKFIRILLVVLVMCVLAGCTACSSEFWFGSSNPNENNDKTFDDYISELAALNRVFSENYYYEIDNKQLGESLLKAYVEATGDKYAVYYTPEEYEALIRDSNGELVGIGVTIVNTNITLNGNIYKAMEIVSVYQNSPALESGICVGDLIMFTGKGEERVSVDEIGYDKALSYMRGEAGTELDIIIYRNDESETLGYKEIPFSITRKKVTTESVTYRICKTDNRVGIVRVAEFDMTTPTQFTNAVDSLISKGCEYFVFDVRSNPGGDLNSVMAIQSYFLKKGDLLLSIKANEAQKVENEEKKYVKAVKYSGNYAGCSVSNEDIGKYANLKMAVLTNGNTASAAELFTATMKDYDKAIVVGEKTYGKGCMQTIMKLTKARHGVDGALRVTTKLYFSASHIDYHDKGIEPDITIVLSEEAKEYNSFMLPDALDNQLQTAIDKITNK